MTERARRPGRLIALEGPDGSGKSAQAERLRAHLAAAGHDVVLVREPGGTPVGERVRAILLDKETPGMRIGQRTDALLFNAARAQLIEDVVAPALAAGRVVISDRTFFSTLAYQGGGGELTPDGVRAVCEFATGGVIADLVVLLDVPVEVGISRKTGSEVTRFEAQFDRAYHERVRATFLGLAAADPARWVVVDASASEVAVFASLRAVADAALEA